MSRVTMKLSAAGVCLAVLVLGPLLAPCGSVQAQSLGSGIKENLDLPFDARTTDADGEDDEELVYQTISFYGQQYEGDSFAYVIDASWSMTRGGQMQRAQMEVKKNIEAFASETRFGIVFFNKEIFKWPENGRSAKATSGNRHAAQQWMRAIQGAGGNCPLEALAAGLRLVQSGEAARRVVVYLGDGGGTCPGAGMGEKSYLKKTLVNTRTMNRLGVRVNVLGLAVFHPTRRKFLESLAAGNGGSFLALP